mmetsp:Transcript_331/g.689  ORF Transcript_331/g.689 Transcript_331/m.689 type:complete len:1928 (+) Transcript_331:176-5959(+)
MRVFMRQFMALNYKNWRMRMKHPIRVILELAIPGLVFWLFIYIRSTMPDKDAQENQILAAPYAAGNPGFLQVPNYHEFFSDVEEPTCSCYDYGGGVQYCYIDSPDSNPFLSCSTWLSQYYCEYDGQSAMGLCSVNHMAVVDGSPAAASTSQDFLDFFNAKFPDFDNVYPIKRFSSESELDDYIQDFAYGRNITGNQYSEKISMALTFNSGYPNWDFKIRMNYTGGENIVGLPTTTTNINDANRQSGSWDKQQNQYGEDKASGAMNYTSYPPTCGDNNYWGPVTACSGMYLFSGFLSVEQMVLDFTLNQTAVMKGLPKFAASTSPLINLYYQNMPLPAYTKDGFWSQVKDLFAIFTVVAFMYPVSGMISELVAEKEKKIKEGMKMMSLGNGALICSWVLNFGLGFWILCVVITFLSGKIFVYSEAKYIFMYFFLYLNSILAFCYWISTLFSRAKIASIAGIMIYFSGYVVTEGVKSSSNHTAKLLASLHPVAAFIFGMNAFVEYEDTQVGVTTYTWDTTSNLDGYTFRDCLAMMAFDILFWAFMTYYCENVLPSEWGTHQHPLFCIDPRFWCGGSRVGSGEVGAKSESGANVESPAADLIDSIKRGEGINIVDLRKSFNTTAGIKHAVDGLNLQMFNNQITCLLGHNGAGKTTTIAMLTGLIDPTSGSASVNGHDVAKEMGTIRKNLGVCPQHDILYPDLTVREHLRLFGKFKGVPSSKLEAEIEDMIREVGLVEKRNELSKNLSGGMKRKLSVGIAFIGGSSVVLLDEPTSGMDPFSRRFTWNVIRKMREGRTIILTTHFMDEADLLGDRIAIMADGKLRCAGSSLFLKQQFGVGYMMAIEKGPNFKEKRVRALIKKNVPEAEELSNVGSELTMQLPLSASKNFQVLFEFFDAQKDGLDIVNYGISVTTLEEVFLKVAHGGDHDTARTKRVASKLKERRSMSARSMSGSLISDDEEIDFGKDGGAEDSYELRKASKVDKSEIRMDSFLGEDESLANLEAQSVRLKAPAKLDVRNNFGYFGRHMAALLMKRLMYFKRDMKAWFFGFLLPAGFVMLGILIISLLPSIFSQPPISLSLESYNSRNPADSLGGRNPVPYNINGSETVCAADAWSGYQPECGEPGLPGCCTPLNTGLIPSNIPAIDGYAIDPVGDAAPATYAEFSSWLLKTRNTTSGARYFAILELGNQKPVSGSPASIQGNEFVIVTNVTAYHAAPTSMMGIYQGIINTLTEANDVSLSVVNHPLPATEQQQGIQQFVNTIFAILMILMGFPFIPSAFIVFMVKEKENKSKHIQLVSGVSPHAFWMATWLWDYMCYQIPLWFTIGTLKYFDIKSLIEGDNFQAVLYLFLLYGPAMAGFCYCCSFYFKSHTNAQIFVIFFSFLTGFLLAIAAFFMQIIESTRDINQTLIMFYRLIPGFCFGHGLLAINAAPIITWSYNADAQKVLPPLDAKIAGDDIKYLLIEAFGYTLLAIIIEYVNATPLLFSWITQCIYRTPPVAEFEEDSDVKEEEERVAEAATLMRSGGSCQDAIMVDGLTKVYPGGKFAVKGLSIGIPYGTCFGLLGINGAGKTTTLSILSGEFPPSAGSAWLAGKDILTKASEVRRLIGYCPQFDALFELMTGYEHLKMYARIKGIVESDIERCVQEQIERMDLTQHAHRLAGGYSGGNKRKLSVACAMIGQPRIIFLDEPSTGMDPVARRFMWSVINDICCAGDTSVILTTHSMEECEALCQRIGIMVGGRFRCLGSAQHLKSKFGLGFQFEFVLKGAGDEELEELEDKIKVANEGGGKKGDLSNLKMADFEKILEALDLAEYMETVREGGGGVHALNEGCNSGFLASWITQENSFRKLLVFMEEKFPGCIMREWQGSKVRFEVPHIDEDGRELKLSEMFGELTREKESLDLQEYSLSQTSLEQVFNKFASTQEEESGKVKGMV